MSRILITGVAGFIGSNLAQQLMDKHEIVGIDNLSTGRKRNLDVIKGIEFKKYDITKPKQLRKIMKGIDYVLHHAALPSVPYSVLHPVETNFVNVQGTFNVFLAAKEANVEKVVFASTAASYGNTNKLPIKESDELSPFSPYAAHKINGEFYAKLFNNVYGLRTTCLRYFNVYGPRQDPNSQYAAVVPKFLQLMQQDKAPTIFGNGKQTRDFVSVMDVVQANMLALKNKKSDGDSFNIANGKKVSVLDLVKYCNLALDKNIVPVFADKRPGDVMHSYASIQKAKKVLGFKPRISLEKGIAMLAKSEII